MVITSRFIKFPLEFYYYSIDFAMYGTGEYIYFLGGYFGIARTTIQKRIALPFLILFISGSILFLEKGESYDILIL
jgi:hypothetical protein